MWEVLSLRVKVVMWLNNFKCGSRGHPNNLEQAKTSACQQALIVNNAFQQVFRRVYLLNPGIQPRLTLKEPITTAADDILCDIFPNFRKKRYDIT